MLQEPANSYQRPKAKHELKEGKTETGNLKIEEAKHELGTDSKDLCHDLPPQNGSQSLRHL